MSQIVLPLLSLFLLLSARAQDLPSQFAEAANGMDREALAALAAGEPETVYPYIYRPGVRMTGWRAEQLDLPDGRSFAVLTKAHSCETQGDHLHPILDGRLGPEISEKRTFGYRIADHRLAVSFDLPAHRVQFEDTLILERTETGAGEVWLRVNPDFRVSSVLLGEREMAFRQAGGTVWIERPPASRVELRLTYAGEAYHPDQFVGNHVSEEEVVLSAYWYPVIARQPATHSVRVTVPRGWLAIGQGDLTARTDSDETSVFEYRMTVPTIYFTLDAGPYHVYAKRVNGRMYQVYSLCDIPDAAERQLDYFDESFRRFEEWFSPYPWDTYTVVETSTRWPGALEAYSFTTYGPGVVEMRSPHEWAHTWWGGIVPGTYLDGSWTESFASYASTLYNRRPNADAPRVLADMLYPRISPGMERAYERVSLYDSADALNSASAAVSYGKGNLVLSYLEYLLGFDTMLEACRNFIHDLSPGKAATWDDFERAVDQATGKDYKRFFDDWVRGKGLPKLWLEDVKRERQGAKWVITGVLRQESPPYHLTVDMLADGPGRNDETFRVSIDSERADFRYECSAKPVAVVIDPELRIPRVIERDEAPLSVNSLSALLRRPDTILVAPEALKDASQSLLQSFPNLDARLDTDLTEEERKTHNLVLIGGPDANRIWRGYQHHCPFVCGEGGVVFERRLYEGGQYFAAAVASHPEAPGKALLFLNRPETPRTNARWAASVVLDGDGRIVDGETARVASGPSVWRFED